MALKPEIIQVHAESITASLDNLKKHCPVSVQNLMNNLDELWILERGLQILIQNVLDIGAHILASEFKNHWDDYTQLIDKLGEYRVIDLEFSKKFRGIAGLRNIIVHEYMEVDLSKVASFCNDHLEDFEIFTQQIFAFLKKREGPFLG